MENFPTHTSAFRPIQSDLQLSEVPPRHADLWNVVQSGLTTGRTYKYSSCCATIYDNRKKDQDRPELNHSDTKTMAKALGKRTFASLVEFSAVITLAEKHLGTPIDTVAFNRNHTETQNVIKIHSLEKRLGTLEQEFQTRTQALECRVHEMEKELSLQKDRNTLLVQAARSAISYKGKICSSCKTRLDQEIDN